MGNNAPGKQKDGCGGFIIAFAFIAIVVSTFLSTCHSGDMKVFEPYLQQYGAMTGDGAANATQQKPVKAIVVSETTDGSGKYQGDPLFFSLPAAMRAKKPDEVNTVIKLRRFENVVGTYTDGTQAKELKITCTIIDLGSGGVIAAQTFTGSAPPSSKTSGGSQSGSSPDREVVEYIKSFK